MYTLHWLSFESIEVAQVVVSGLDKDPLDWLMYELKARYSNTIDVKRILTATLCLQTILPVRLRDTADAS